ncbi:MAG: hypothetical protein PHD46_07775 [Eubacteriales bacterium]|nr:hypothetical protein [Eubacteriales bacterium]
MDNFAKGSNFGREKTGSETMINLNGRWKQNFVDDDIAAGEKTRIKSKKQIKPNDYPKNSELSGS